MLADRSWSTGWTARGPASGARAPGRLRKALAALVACGCVLGASAGPAFGEGSVDVNRGPDANSRHGLVDATSGNFGGPGSDPYAVLYVYAQAGETVQLGSSAMAFAGTNISVYAPGTTLEGRGNTSNPVFAADLFDCRTNDPGTGVIADGLAGRAQELAGPLPNAGGYNACEFTPTTTGIFPVIMTSPDPGAGAGAGTVGVPDQAANSWAVAIWDITVRNASGVQSGRVFSNQFVFWETETPSGGVRVFPYTRTGYEYQVEMFDHNGAGWSLRADDQGIVSTATGERLFASFDCRLNVTDVTNVCSDTRAAFAAPEARYPLFVNRPDPIVITGPGGLAATRGYATAPIAPSSNPVTSAFTGSGGQAGAVNLGSGGTFAVTSPAQMAGLGSTLEIDTNRNGTFGDSPDYVDSQDLEADGSTTFAWSGRDAAGSVPACGDYPYRVRSTLAEVHFPMYDVETSGGTQIRRLSLPDDPTLGDPLAASYNDRDPFKNRNVTNATPIAADAQTSSSTFHAWGDAAGVGGGDTDFIDTWVQLPEVQAAGTLRLLCADVKVEKSADPSPMVPGTDQTFRITVTNNGPDTATNVTASDKLPAGFTFSSASPECVEAGGTVTCSLASLASGASRTFEITGRVDSSVDHCLENSATVGNDTPDPDMSNNTHTICVPIKGKTDLKIVKTPSDTTVRPGGGQVIYTLVITNDGPSDATGVKVSDPLAQGLTLVSADPAKGTCETANNTVSCDIGDLKSGGSTQVLVTATTWATPGNIVNTAKVGGDQEDPTPENNTSTTTITVTEEPPVTYDLVTEKRADVSRPRVGQKVTYTIVATNNGPGPAVNSRMTETLDSPVKVVSVDTTQGECGKKMPITCSLGTIEAGGNVTVTVVVRHREAGSGQINAASTVAEGSDGDPSNNTGTATVNVRKVTLKVTKVASRKNVRAGQAFTYTIKVTNTSKGQARRVKTCDRLPSGLAYVSSTPRAKLSKGRQCWTAKLLKAGRSKTYKVKVRATRGASGTKVNRVTATSPDAKKARAKRAINVIGGAVLPDAITG